MGALLGSFGTVAWLTVLCAPTFGKLVLGVLALGAAPVAAGGALLWAGLGLLETEASRSRVRAITDARFVEAAGCGATSSLVGSRLGLGDLAEVERRLDALCARDLLALDVTEEGEVRYRSVVLD